MGVAYGIYATPPQVREASAVFTKHLRPKLRQRKCAGVSAPNSNEEKVGVF